jgi:PAS domain S-box-containing protein
VAHTPTDSNGAVAGNPAERDALAALRESEQRFRLALAGTNQGLYDLNLRTGQAIVSEEYARMLGYEPGQTELSASWWSEHLHPDDRETSERIMGECVRGERTEYRIEYRMRTVSGAWKWILSIGKVIEHDGQGRPLRMLGTHTDVTERHESEEALLAARSLMESIVEQTPVPMVVVSSPDLVIRYSNQAAIEALGITDEPRYKGWFLPEAFKNKSWKDFTTDGTPIPPEELPLSFALQGRTVQGREFILQRKDGTRRWHIASAAPVHAEDGRLVAAIVVFPDITERRQAEEMLEKRRDSESLVSAISSRFVNLGSASIDAAIVEALAEIGRFTGADRCYVFFYHKEGTAADNTHEWCAEGIEPQRARLQGLPTNGFRMVNAPLARSEVVFIPRVDALPPESVEERREFTRQGIKSLLLVPIEFRKDVVGFLGLDAVRREASWSAETVPLLRTVGEVFAGALDRAVTEQALRFNEERYRVVSDVGRHLLFDCSLDSGAVEWMGRIEELTGYLPAELNGMGYRGWGDLIHPDDREEVQQRLRESMRDRSFHRVEYRIRRKDGSYMPVEARGTFVYGEDGRALRMVGSLSDESEKRKAQEERQRLHEQLQQAMKMEAVGRLAGGIAHDFNNLLTTIVGNVELARMEEDLPEAVVRSLQEIGSAAESAAGLTRQLLAFSRRQIIEPRVVGVNALVSRLQKMLTRLIGEDVVLETSLTGDPGRVRVDPGQLEQVLVNLVVNARDAMPDGGRILVETGERELDGDFCRLHPDVRPGRFVRLAVSDTGHGMSDEVKKHLFEPFFTTKPTGRGTGLGLATIFGTVKQAGGAVEVFSEVGRGTTVAIYLPPAAEEAAPEAEKDGQCAPAAGCGTILLVEDEPGVRTLARTILSRLGYAVLEACGGEEAEREARLHAGRIDLLFTDVVMPGQNGRELAVRLLAIHPEMKVLYTSGYTEDSAVLRGVVEANLHFIGKPYALRTLAAKITEVLGLEG